MEGRKMCHGYVDEIPGHGEFWRQYHSSGGYTQWRDRIKYKYRMLKRLWNWKRNIRKLKKICPNCTLYELERELVEIEASGALKAILWKEEK
jgi:hypothetical protein